MNKVSIFLWFLSYKMVWLICVLGGGVYGHPFMSSVPMLVWVSLWILMSEKRREVFLLAIFSLLYGTCWDSMMTAFEIMSFSPTAQTGTPIPLWMMMLWLGFGTIYTKCFAALRKNMYVLSFIGAVGGPMAYLGGAKMEAMTIGASKAVFFVAIGLEWMLALPLFMWFSMFLEADSVHE